MQTNENRTKSGKSKILILKTGVWRWSRHPKYACTSCARHATVCLRMQLLR